MARISVLAAALALTTALATGLVPTAAAARTDSPPHPGAASAGDPYYPRQGNGGYNVWHYDLHVRYEPARAHLIGSATITARAKQSLSRFDLDLRHFLTVSKVTVNGHVATFRQPAAQVQELVITPRAPLVKDHFFTVHVDYAGPMRDVTDPDGSPDGVIATNDGAFVASEPQGSPTWFPVNDTPRDKATYRVTITVPKGLVAISNGAFLGTTSGTATSTWRWSLSHPVSSYLITSTFGRFDVRTGHTRKGVPYLIAVDPTQRAKADPVLAKLPAIVDYFTAKYGRYPFGHVGAIVDNATQVGYALETATRPEFDRAPDAATLAHELAHQWFGDDVTLQRWRDIWLNEGFAEFSSWLWLEHSGGPTAAQQLKRVLARPASDSDTWSPPPADPGSAANVFSNSVYVRGAATLEALRQKLGGTTFFAILRGWLVRHAYGSGTVPEFTAYAAKIAHRDLSHFFFEWLYKTGKPTG